MDMETDTPIEAGPSRSSPAPAAAPSRSPTPPPLPPASAPTSTDIIMEDALAPVVLDTEKSTESAPQAENDEAVQLLLNISAPLDVPSVLPIDTLMEVMPEQPPLENNTPIVDITAPIPLDVRQLPEAIQQPEEAQAQSAQPPPIVSPLPPSLVITSTAAPLDPSLPNPTPSTTTDAPTKPAKQKRKRNATAGPSRRASQEHQRLDTGDHPQHWLGEDNTIIRCICGFTEDDGFTIQCEGCGAWEHGICFGYVDATSAPDTYLCELCEPRPVDAAAAKETQLLAMDQARLAREALVTNGVAPTIEKPRSRGGKTKRQRTESVIDGDAEPRDGTLKEASPGVMGPPAPKPRRKQQGKPRAKQNNNESTPGPGPSSTSGIKDQQQHQPVVEEPEDDYFRIEPWALEYTPIKESLVRGVTARRIMRTVYREWVDAEEEALDRHSRPIHNPSGLPSPTETGIMRLSPDHIFPPPDFHILAPPVPPAFLLGSDLETLASAISVRLIEDAPSFLPLSYAENVLGHGVYTRPAIYGIFAEEPITTGSFVGEYRGEIFDCETYRRDPINQYAALGLPKPHVRGIGPPINLIIDARGYGSNLRFVRSGCHPNVVLRPFIWRKEEDEPPKLKFGIFAAKDIDRKDEIILGWEWDDQHVVHSLRSTIHAAMLSDGSLANPWTSASPKTLRGLSSKFDAVLTHIFGTFTSCACVVPGNCALAQMGHLVDQRIGTTEDHHHHGQQKLRVDLGELVGGVRGWRRRELELDSAKRWEMSDLLRTQLARSITRSEASEQDIQTENENEAMDVDIDQTTQRHSSPVPMTDRAESPIVNSTKTPQKTPEKVTAFSKLVDVEVSQMATPPSKAPSSAAEAPASSSSLSSAASSRQQQNDMKDHDDDDEEMDSGSGDESDATTATIPKSQFSESDPEPDSEAESSSSVTRSDVLPSLPIPISLQTGKLRKASTKIKVRRILSPVIEATQFNFDHLPVSEDEEERELVVKKPKKKTRLIEEKAEAKIPKVKKSTNPNQTSVPDKKNSIAAAGRRARQKRIVSSSASEDDENGMDMDSPAKSVPVTTTTTKTKSKNNSSSSASPKSSKDIKLEHLSASVPKPNLLDKEKEKEGVEERAVVADQVVAPMSSPVDLSDSIIDRGPRPEAEAEAEVALGAELENQEKESSPPPVLEPKEPTPPPEPPKKVSFSEYLKNHKFRKESQTPSTESASTPPTALTSTLELSTSADSTTAPSTHVPASTPAAPAIGIANNFDIPGFGTHTAVKLESVQTQADPVTPAATAKLNLFEHLPSARPPPPPTPGSGTITESPRGFSTPLPTPTPAPSYVPRQVSGEYFPPQSITSVNPNTPAPAAAPAYVPRAGSTSFTPRPEGKITSAYVPRQSSISVSVGDEQSTPPKEPHMPPPLLSRDLPPHTPTSTNSSLPLLNGTSTPTSTPTSFGTGTGAVSVSGGRLPPTGPKVPPTGPRGIGASASGSTGRGGFAPPIPGAGRGFRGGGSGGWRGKGFRGGWRGS